MTKSVKQIIFANLIVYIVTYSLSLCGLYLNNILSLYPYNSYYFGVAQLLTHLFAHDDFNHFFFNMLFLYIFGPDVEKFFGHRKFWILFLTGGLVGSIYYFLIDPHPVLGASAAVFSVMSAYPFIIYKKESVINLKSIIVSIFIIGEVYSTFLSVSDNVGHISHVLGAIWGIFYFITSDKIETSQIK